MTEFYIFLIIGFIFLVGEITTGTFYLLVIAVASIIAAIFALFFKSILIPILASVILSIIGCVIVNKKLKRNLHNNMVVEHIGQMAEVVEVFDNKIKVLYSGSYWNAVINTHEELKVGDNVKIVKFSNSLLTVEKC